MNELLDALRDGYRFTAVSAGFAIRISLYKDGFIIHRMIDSQVIVMSLLDVIQSEIAKMRIDFKRGADDVTSGDPATPPQPSTPAIEQPRPSDGPAPE